ncbi:MAG: PAS domain-containing protein [Hyphomonadaceae bacterium]
MLQVNADHCELNPMQAKLLDHWHEIAKGDGIPRRVDLDPGKFACALGNISLVELGENGFKFRLAGSLLHDIFADVDKGGLLSEIDMAVEEAGSASMSIALETGRAVFGDRQLAGRWHSWLRLPLRDETGAARLVLCFDQITNSPSGANVPHILQEVQRRHAMIAA